MEKQFVVVVNGEVAYGPSEVNGSPSDEMKRLEKQTGGKIYPAFIHKPPLNVRMQVYGNSVPTIGEGQVDYHSPVVDRTDSAIHLILKSEIKKAAAEKIIKIYGIEDAPENLWWKEMNSIMDEDAETIAKIQAVRDASNELEELLEAMEVEELAALDVAGWEGWPGADEPEIATTE